MKVLVIGADGQLGSAIKALNPIPGLQFTYVDVGALDITNRDAVHAYFEKQPFDYCVNCAAYTAVDKAEEEIELATAINVNGAKNLALACDQYQVILIHISTDFVFDGHQTTPYLETDKPNPLSVYGQTKWAGELAIQEVSDRHFILRTSWLYSEFGNNFLKTMWRLGAERSELRVVDDQIGTPTYARDLAAVIVAIVEQRSEAYGLYHYSNEGFCSWSDFAKSIFKQHSQAVVVHPISTAEYPTAATRPKYSVMNKQKIIENLRIAIPSWEDALKKAISLLHC